MITMLLAHLEERVKDRLIFFWRGLAPASFAATLLLWRVEPLDRHFDPAGFHLRFAHQLSNTGIRLRFVTRVRWWIPSGHTITI